MKALRAVAIAFLLLAGFAAAAAGHFAPAGYEHQFRELPASGPSAQHPLGTDDLGRDNLARLLYGMRTSLVLAPLAAGLSIVIAAFVGGIAGYCGGWVEKSAMALIDLVLSIPWIFLLITVRAVLPLNTSPAVSVVVTFALLGMLGWAASARVVCAGAKQVMHSEFIWNARAMGFSGLKLLKLHLIPNLKPTLLAQFWISIPVFIIAEANLGALGLGVAEPLPSLGSLLRELQDSVMLRPEPWRLLPLVVLIAVVSAFQVVLSKQEVRA